jgi:inosine-uridine nucleoside N-ribohydrolase
MQWNVYWDAPSAGVVWNSAVPVTIVPLDATNKVRLAEALWHSKPFAVIAEAAEEFCIFC